MLGQGVRVPWPELPPSVRAAVGALAGAPAVAAETCVGGFSPGAAARLTLAGGGRAFVKAVSTAQNPESPAFYRGEAAVNGWLPAHPAIPRLLGVHDDGDWVALVFEHVDAGTPALPWRRADLSALLATLRSVQEAGTPAPAAAPAFTEAFAEDFGEWRRLAGSAGGVVAGLDAWTLAHLDRLAALEEGWTRYAGGDALLHCDVRADNALVRDGHAWLVDWPWACAGAAWVDGVLFAPTVPAQGGPPPEEVMAEAYPDAPPEGVLALLAGLAGFFTMAALQPAPQGLPTVRAHQAATGRACREWLARLLT